MTTSYDGSDLEGLLVLRRYRAWILDEFRPFLKGRTAEIGAGIGSYSLEILPDVSTLDAIEPSSALFSRLQARLSSTEGARALALTAEQWLTGASAESYDTVVMINVLEHIADDSVVLRQIHDTLRPDGNLLLFVPALMALYSPLDRLFGHYRRYSQHELLAKVKAAGFTVQSCRYFDFLGVAPWYLVNRLMGAQRFMPSAAQLYDRVGVPLTRFLERHIRPPIGKNLILVATRAPTANEAANAPEISLMERSP